MEQGILNCVEAVVRTFDRFLSCSTQAVGTYGLANPTLTPQGAVQDAFAASLNWQAACNEGRVMGLERRASASLREQ
jgi:hypothetical protein